MQVLNLQQGSLEWFQARLGVATASNFSKLITSQGKESATLNKYALELASQLMLSEPESGYKSDIMQRGNDLEPVARQAYQEATGNFVEEAGFMLCDNYGYSPDGLIGKSGLIEIKCPIATTHTKYLEEDRLPTDYVAQCQGGLLVSGRKWLDFVSYHPNFKRRQIFIKRVERDENFIDNLKLFINKVITERDKIINKI